MKLVLMLLTILTPMKNEEFFKICEDYEVPHDPMKYRDQKFIGLISMVLVDQTII